MAVIAQDGVAHIVVVGRLHMVKEDDILQLHAVAYHAVGAHQGGAADKGAVSYFGVRSDDAGRTQISTGKYFRCLMYPYILGYLIILLRREGLSQGKDHVLDALQRLPGIGKLAQIIGCQGMIQVI